MNAAVGCSLQLLLTLIVAETKQRNSAADDETIQAACGRTSSDIVSNEMYTVDHLGKPTTTRMVCARRLCWPIIINATGNTFMEDLSVFDAKKRHGNGSDMLMEDTYAGETGRRDSNTFSTTVVSAVLQQPVPQQATYAGETGRRDSNTFSTTVVRRCYSNQYRNRLRTQARQVDATAIRSVQLLSGGVTATTTATGYVRRRDR